MPLRPFTVVVVIVLLEEAAVVVVNATKQASRSWCTIQAMELHAAYTALTARRMRPASQQASRSCLRSAKMRMNAASTPSETLLRLQMRVSQHKCHHLAQSKQDAFSDSERQSSFYIVALSAWVHEYFKQYRYVQ